ncbi:MAG: TetR/AcrR family transcriptional regulator [Chitinophagales bacterium]|nr:TetR/AcrR family transcriptional regulator [Chitinophagaceae bacterium]MCB9063828.1 TetR/AcrR family transcriptional regulator [Chitinophagales bacterium]
MTEKQEKILGAALELFAKDGYHATSTSKIAKHAGVSEALIFRHFENKEGLLNAIMDVGGQKAHELYAKIVFTTDPKELLKKAINILFEVPEEEYEMWRLMYALKWQTNGYNTESKEPLMLALNNAFKKLGYKNPEAESELILMIIDGAVTSFLLHPPKNKEDIRKAIFDKYDL